MAEYIDREALMNQIKEIHCAECDNYNGLRCRACWVDDTLDYIDSEPAADVAPVRHGRWGTHSDRPDSLICSVCKCGFDMWKHDPHNYCPNCGAKMDGEDQKC